MISKVAERTLARISEEKHGPEHRAAEVLELREALKMLYDLLEEHAPSWYTEEHHDKAEVALRFAKNDVTSASRACRARARSVGGVP